MVTEIAAQVLVLGKRLAKAQKLNNTPELGGGLTISSAESRGRIM